MHGLISFNPSEYTVVVKRGSNLGYLRDQNKGGVFNTQTEEIRTKFTSDVDGRFVYSIERLLVEIDTFEIDELIKREAIRNLWERCNPSKVEKVIIFLKKKKKRISKTSIEFLEQKKIDFSDITKQNAEEFIREYLMNRIFESKITHFIKGGSAVEVYTSKKRGTNDIDGYYNINEHNKIINALEVEKDSITFIVKDFNNKNFKNIETTQRARMIIGVKSRNNNLNSIIKNIEITLDVDYSIDEKDMIEIIEKYKLKKTKLWKQNRHYFPITREMLIAEKVMSLLDSQKKIIWRAKDMMDVSNLLKQKDIKNEIIKEWFIYKIKSFDILAYRKFLDELITTKEEKEKLLKGTLSTYAVNDFDWNKVVSIVKYCLK